MEINEAVACILMIVFGWVLRAEVRPQHLSLALSIANWITMFITAIAAVALLEMD